MAEKFYQFDYAELNGSEIKNIGILNVRSTKNISKDTLKKHTREHLNNPDANIFISNITKLTKSEFEQISNTTTI